MKPEDFISIIPCSKMLFTLNNKLYDTPNGQLLFQSHVIATNHGIDSFVYLGTKQWNYLPVDDKYIECFDLFKNYLITWMGPVCRYGYCILCAKNWYWISRSLETNVVNLWHFNICCDIRAFKDSRLKLFYSWWLLYVFVEILKSIWSYIHIKHKDTIFVSGLSQKSVLYFIYQR